MSLYWKINSDLPETFGDNIHVCQLYMRHYLALNTYTTNSELFSEPVKSAQICLIFIYRRTIEPNIH